VSGGITLRLYARVINGKSKPIEGQKKKNQKPKTNKQTNKQTQVNQAQGMRNKRT
jgi:hypothetical protein